MPREAGAARNENETGKMTMRSMRTFAAGLLIGVGLWMPVFVAASAEGDAHGWSTLVALGLFAFAALLGARFDRQPVAAKPKPTLPPPVPSVAPDTTGRSTERALTPGCPSCS
jgi:hypothetical protein